jgi:hypothetical protein
MEEGKIKYWTTEAYNDLERASEFSHLFPIALKVVQKMPQPLGMVSGPITTGGSSIDENVKVFAKIIGALAKEGKPVFNQLPFQNIMIRLWHEWPEPGYCMPILTDFYLPLFESGYIKKVYFIPGWEQSFGASWEHAQCKKLGIERIHLSEQFIKILKEEMEREGSRGDIIKT